MAHFVYPAGTPLGTVSFGYVVPHTDWQTTIQQVFKGINGDDGGTWAPGAFITVGGSGFQLTGTGHSLATSARLNVETGAEIRLKNGSLLKADGAGGDIRLEVLTNVATLTIQSGAVQKVEAGGALDVYGGLTFKDTSGPGNATWEANTTAIFSSGSILTAASGSTVNLSGNAYVRGTLTIKSSGGPGAFVAEATTSFDIATALARVNSGGALTFQSGSTLSGAASSFGQWSGVWWMANGSTTTFKNGSALSAESGAAATWAGDFTFTGDTTIGNSKNLLLDPARDWERAITRLEAETFEGGGSIATAMFSQYHTDTPMVQTTASLANTDHQLVLAMETPPDGGIITEVVMTTRGVTNEALSVKPKFRVIRWRDGFSAAEYMSLLTTDDHSGTGSNWITEVSTTIAITAHATIDSGYRYGVLVTMPMNTAGTPLTTAMWVAGLASGTIAKVTGK